MGDESIIQGLINSNNEIYIELALIVNKDMYESNLIPYNIYKIVEDTLLRKVKDEKV